MRETFSTNPDKNKRERLQSQGASKKPTLDNVKPQARKAIQDELNQTMKVTSHTKKAVETLEVSSAIGGQRKREGGSEVPKNRREGAATIEFTADKTRFSSNVPSPTVAPSNAG